MTALLVAITLALLLSGCGSSTEADTIAPATNSEVAGTSTDAVGDDDTDGDDGTALAICSRTGRFEYTVPDGWHVLDVDQSLPGAELSTCKFVDDTPWPEGPGGTNNVGEVDSAIVVEVIERRPHDIAADEAIDGAAFQGFTVEDDAQVELGGRDARRLTTTMPDSAFYPPNTRTVDWFIDMDGYTIYISANDAFGSDLPSTEAAAAAIGESIVVR